MPLSTGTRIFGFSSTQAFMGVVVVAGPAFLAFGLLGLLRADALRKATVLQGKVTAVSHRCLSQHGTSTHLHVRVILPDGEARDVMDRSDLGARSALIGTDVRVLYLEGSGAVLVDKDSNLPEAAVRTAVSFLAVGTVLPAAGTLFFLCA